MHQSYSASAASNTENMTSSRQHRGQPKRQVDDFGTEDDCGEVSMSEHFFLHISKNKWIKSKLQNNQQFCVQLFWTKWLDNRLAHVVNK